jgi:hypothetical protein
MGTQGIIAVVAIGVLVASVAFGVSLIGNSYTSATTPIHSTTTSAVASSTSISVTTTSISTTSSSNSSCASSLEAYSNSDTRATVYDIRSSYSLLCVNYQFEGAGLANFTTTVQPWYQNGSQVGSTQCVTSCVLPIITASPSFSNHSARAVVNVTYTILSPANMTGLFIVFHDGCDPLYLSFGAVPSSVFLTAWTCGPNNVLTGGFRSGNYSVTGFTNIEAYSVPWA